MVNFSSTRSLPDIDIWCKHPHLTKTHLRDLKAGQLSNLCTCKPIHRVGRNLEGKLTAIQHLPHIVCIKRHETQRQQCVLQAVYSQSVGDLHTQGEHTTEVQEKQIPQRLPDHANTTTFPFPSPIFTAQHSPSPFTSPATHHQEVKLAATLNVDGLVLSAAHLFALQHCLLDGRPVPSRERYSVWREACVGLPYNCSGQPAFTYTGSSWLA
ncbi:hypothetical protein E2C01_011970 [Portunus trituberculatus]|uniref:Uncharacterized protein n=1 Tax=Portunus trituberculatus TaxID=210409 RepID=A0A5B7DCS0_PORTR|nr:hypothetical protein [Portunus trituberculatus]